MMRFLPLLVACIPFVAVAAPVPAENDSGRMRRIYGEVLDPDKDCMFEMKGNSLRIGIPAKHHSLDRKPGLWNAPRICKEIEGDFVVTVRVSFPIRPSPGPKAGSLSLEFAGGGLIAWAPDGETIRFMRLERRSGDKQGESYSRIWDWAAPGKVRGAKYSLTAFKEGRKEGHLRLERKGQKAISTYSEDGKTWTHENYISPVDVGWGPAVKVGVIAENGYGAPFTATFDQYTLTQPKR